MDILNLLGNTLSYAMIGLMVTSVIVGVLYLIVVTDIGVDRRRGKD
jgi:hypothetical protein|tara:strand:+ start:720 stop:857 length:138 start_codon:yes stop_codon:yes gene_type:complete